MLKTYVALFRGINVGTAKRIKMAELKEVMANHGFLNIKTVLNSGNVIFSYNDTPEEKLAGIISGLVEEKLGVSAPVIVLNSSVIKLSNEENPMGNLADNPTRLLFAFTQDSESLHNLAELENNNDYLPGKLVVKKNAAYIWCPNGIHKEKLFVKAQKLMNNNITTRNQKTIEKILSVTD